MSKENAVLNAGEKEYDEVLFDFDKFEEMLESQLEEEMSKIEFLECEKEKIDNPDELGRVILDEVWKQFGNQIGLDMTNETLIQKYDREHPEEYSEIGQAVMKDQKYKDANKDMKKQKEAGDLKDVYTGKIIKPNESANLDHVVARKEIFDNQRRKQADLSTEQLANKSENLQPTNESLNKSKGAKSIDEYLDTRVEREKKLKAQNERANKKVEKSNKSDTEKRLQKEKNDKRLQDKLDANDEMMKKADKDARKAINKDVRISAAKEIGKKAGSDALKAMAVSGMFSLLKEVMNALVRFLKSQAKSFKVFLDEMKKAVKSFIAQILDILQTGASTLVGTIVSEIFGPIVSTFKKLASLIKQGASSVIDAIKYLNDKSNKSKPFSVKAAQVGKIITTGLAAGGSILLGELFEKTLLTVPGMQIKIPYVGTLANMIGMFLASLVSGVVGAIMINRIDKFIAKRQKYEMTAQQVDKRNKILGKQREIRYLNEMRLDYEKEQNALSIKERHIEAKNIMRESLGKICNDEEKKDHQVDFDEMDSMLSGLMD